MDTKGLKVYTAKDTLGDILYIPKLNTDLFRDGNGIPLFRRDVHTYTEHGRYKEIGCDSSIEHGCPLCGIVGEMYYSASKRVAADVHKYTHSDKNRTEDEVEAHRELVSAREFLNIQFRKDQKVYLVVAKVSDNCNEKLGYPDFELNIMCISLSSYTRYFKDLILASDEGVYLSVTYPDAKSMIEKVRGRKIEAVKMGSSYQSDLETAILREFKSLHRLDIEAVKPELAMTSYDTALRLAKANKEAGTNQDQFI